jgi:hypothetical protein
VPIVSSGPGFLSFATSVIIGCRKNDQAPEKITRAAAVVVMAVPIMHSAGRKNRYSSRIWLGAWSAIPGPPARNGFRLDHAFATPFVET